MWIFKRITMMNKLLKELSGGKWILFWLHLIIVCYVSLIMSVSVALLKLSSMKNNFWSYSISVLSLNFNFLSNLYNPQYRIRSEDLLFKPKSKYNYTLHTRLSSRTMIHFFRQYHHHFVCIHLLFVLRIWEFIVAFATIVSTYFRTVWRSSRIFVLYLYYEILLKYQVQTFKREFKLKTADLLMPNECAIIFI